MNNIHTEIEERIANILELTKQVSAGKLVWFKCDLLDIPGSPKSYLDHSENMQDKVDEIKALLLDAQAEGYKRGYIAGGIEEFNKRAKE